MDDDIEQLRRFREKFRRLPKTQRDEIVGGLDPDLLKRLHHSDYGLTTEEEFQFIVRLLGRVSVIQPITQYSGSGMEPVPSDYLVVFEKEPIQTRTPSSDSIRCLVEVKRGWNLKWKTSPRDFDRRIRYARARQLRLFFAVKFASPGSEMWMMFPAEYVKLQGYKLGFGDLRASVFDVITGNFQIHLPACVVEEKYVRGRSAPAEHLEYGGLSSLLVISDGKNLKSQDSRLWKWILRAFPSHVDDVSRKGEVTLLRRTFESQILSAHQAVDSLMCVVHRLDDLADRSVFRADWAKGRVRSPVSLEVIQALVLDMERAGVLQSFRLVPDLKLLRGAG